MIFPSLCGEAFCGSRSAYRQSLKQTPDDGAAELSAVSRISDNGGQLSALSKANWAGCRLCELTMNGSNDSNAGSSTSATDKGHVETASPMSTPLPSPASAAPALVRRVSKRDYAGEKETMNGPLYMQASNNVVIVRRIKRKGESPMKQLSRWFVENQIGMSSSSAADTHQLSGT